MNHCYDEPDQFLIDERTSEIFPKKPKFSIQMSQTVAAGQGFSTVAAFFNRGVAAAILFYFWLLLRYNDRHEALTSFPSYL
jgi:hypothetical protein